MNRVIILLAGLLVMFIGLMVFNGDDDKPVQQANSQQQQQATGAGDVTEVERDDYVNTIKTINARAVGLETQVKELNERLAEQDKNQLTQKDVETIAQRSTEQRARDFKSVMDKKYKEFSSVLDDVKNKNG